MKTLLAVIQAILLTACVLCISAPTLRSQDQASPQAAAAAQPSDEFPAGAGRDVFLQLCSNCHNPDNVFRHNLSSDDWTDLLNRMIQNGAQGTDDQFSTILNYLSTNFGPVPDKINVNKVTALNLRNWLNFSQQQADAVISYRKQNGDFKTLDDLKKVPGIDPKILDAQKDHLAF